LPLIENGLETEGKCGERNLGKRGMRIGRRGMYKSSNNSRRKDVKSYKIENGSHKECNKCSWETIWRIRKRSDW